LQEREDEPQVEDCHVQRQPEPGELNFFRSVELGDRTRWTSIPYIIAADLEVWCEAGDFWDVDADPDDVAEQLRQLRDLACCLVEFASSVGERVAALFRYKGAALWQSRLMVG